MANCANCLAELKKINTPLFGTGKLLSGEIICINCIKNLNKLNIKPSKITLESVKLALPYTVKITSDNIYTNPKINPEQKIKIVSGLIALCFIIWLFFIPSCNTETTKNKELIESQNEISTNTTEIKNTDTIGQILFSSLADLKTKFNSFAKQNEFSLRINNINCKEISCTYAFSNSLALLIVKNDKKNVIELSMIAGGKGINAVNVLLCMGTIIAITNPNLTTTERGNVLKELGFIGDDIDLTKLNNKITINGMHYSSYYSSLTGIMFSVH